MNGPKQLLSSKKGTAFTATAASILGMAAQGAIDPTFASKLLFSCFVVHTIGQTFDDIFNKKHKTNETITKTNS